jgi:lipoate---protein ligase
MQYLDLTLPTAAENIALDEALLEQAEASAAPMEVLRLWQANRPLVVVGRSSQIDVEVNADACRALKIPVLRRTSGGAAIVTGPGCLMYALVLNYQLRPHLRPISQAHSSVLGTLAAALGALVPGVQCRGTSDLAVGEHKFSGNSARCRRNCLLYHGTLLYDFPLELIERCLALPPRMPDYRQVRPHHSFVRNLPADSAAIRQALVAAWDAHKPLDDWPVERTAQLVADKYGRPEWNEAGTRSA